MTIKTTDELIDDTVSQLLREGMTPDEYATRLRLEFALKLRTRQHSIAHVAKMMKLDRRTVTKILRENDE